MCGRAAEAKARRIERPTGELVNTRGSYASLCRLRTVGCRVGHTVSSETLRSLDGGSQRDVGHAASLMQLALAVLQEAGRSCPSPGCTLVLAQDPERDTGCKRCRCRRETRIGATRQAKDKAREGAWQSSSIFTFGARLAPMHSKQAASCIRSVVPHGRCRRVSASFGSWAAASEQPEHILGLHVCLAAQCAWGAFYARSA